MQEQDNDRRVFVVAYVGQSFDLTARQAELLMDAQEKGFRSVRFDEKMLTTSFLWIAPKEEVEGDRLSVEEEAIVGKIERWLSRPAHDLDMSSEQVHRYAVRVVKRIGSAKAIRNYERYANGAYPSARKFMTAVKEESGVGVQGLDYERLGTGSREDE